MTYKTTLPSQTVGSLGPTKVNRSDYGDPAKDHLAEEINEANECIVELFTRIGLSNGTTADSFEERVTDVENIVDDGHLWYNNPLAVGSGSNWVEWDPGGVNYPIGCGTYGGGVRFESDDDQLAAWPGGYQFIPDQEPSFTFYVRVNGTFTDPGGTAYIFTCDNAASDDSYGIALGKSSVPKIYGFVETGGVAVNTDTGIVWAAGAEYKFHCYVAGGHWWVSINNNDAVDCGVVQADAVQPQFWSHNETRAGEYWRLRMLKVQADWTSGDTDG